MNDDLYARTLLELGIASPAQLEAARRKTAELVSRGTKATLRAVLMKSGIVTAEGDATIRGSLGPVPSCESAAPEATVLESGKARPPAGRARVASGPAPATRYVLGEELGRGGMGQVHLATDQDLRREVAIN